MRTTLTLDDDVGSCGVSRTYRMPTSNLGPIRSGINLDKALQLAAELEDEESIRKLELGR